MKFIINLILKLVELFNYSNYLNKFNSDYLMLINREITLIFLFRLILKR